MSQRQGFHRDRPLWLVTVLLVCAGALAFEPRASAQNADAAGASTEQQVGSGVPRRVKFSGEVKDASGKLASGAVNLIFSLYESQDGGPPLWSETQRVNLDAQGRYNVLLGATHSDGLPLDVFTTGQARWLGVQPALPGVGEQPRVLLVGVPYALKAADADTLGGKPPSAFMLTGSEPANQAQGAASVPAGAGAAGSQKVASSGRAPNQSGTSNAACVAVTVRRHG